MIPKDVKPSSSYPQIFFTLLQERKINKKSIENKKRIYIYISIICISIYKQQLQLVAGKWRISPLAL